MKNRGRWYSNKSKHDNHATPQRVKDFLKENCGINWNKCFDPCPLNAKRDGLKIRWGKRNVLNPPYSEIEKFAEKANQEVMKGKIVYFLFPLDKTDKPFFHKYLVRYQDRFIFIPFRIKFVGNDQPAFQTHVLITMW